LAIVCAAADFCTTIVPRFGTPLVALEVRREAAADARTKVMWRVAVRGSSGTWLKFSGLLIPIQLPQGTAHSSVIGFLLAVCAATACADARTEKTEWQRNPKPTAAPRLSSAPEQGLKFIVGARRLDSPSFNGESLLASLKAVSCRLRNLLFVLCSKLFFLFLQQESRSRVVFDTRVFPQIIGKFAPLHDHALFSS
jgi:hypothetical protein